MDSLHVSSGQQQSHQHQGSSKTSSRSASPCRLQQQQQQQQHQQTGVTSTPQQQQSQPPPPHHKKTLSHGSVDSNKSDGVNYSSKHHRHRSPTSSSSTPRTDVTAEDVSASVHHQHHDSSVASSKVIEASTMGDGYGGSSSGSGVGQTDASHTNPSASSYTTSNGSEHLTTIRYQAPQSASAHQQSLMQQHQHQHQLEEETDSPSSNVHNSRTNASIEHLGNKIIRVKDLIRTEQKLRDDNVNEYLKLAANADRQQVQRIKAVFEKKNQKSAQVISQLQKKLDGYQKRMHELETHGAAASSHRPTREVLRDVGQGLKNVGGNIRDGITGFSGTVMSKPREFAHLIKNKFGSADNISQLSTVAWYIGPGTTGSEGSATNDHHGPAGARGAGSDQGEKTHHHHHHHHGSATLPATLHSANSNTSMGQGQGAGGQKFPSEEGSECSSVTSESIERYHVRTQEVQSSQDQFNLMYKQLMDAREEMSMLRKKLESSTLQQEIQFLNSSLQDEKFKMERLEEQINDLTELHQNEVENLKQAMADMEEKVQYQSEERLRDIHEILEHCQTKIQKMEHQAFQQQQYVTLEGLDNSNARAFAVKLINVLLTVLQVILLLVATCAGIIMPFLRTRVRILTTVAIVFLGLFVLRQWPEVQDIGSHVMKRLKDMLDPVK